MAMFSRRSAADILTSLAKNQRFRFWRDTRAAATALMGVAVVIMSVGAGAFISDHLWVVDQRDKLKSATDAASVAAMVEMNDILLENPDIPYSDLHAAVKAVARRYVIANLGDLSPDRYARAVDSLRLQVTVEQQVSAVTLQAEADLGGYLFASMLPLLSGVTPLTSVNVSSAVEQAVAPTHIVLAIDTSTSMGFTLSGGTPGLDDPSKGDITKDAAKAMVDFLSPNAHNRIAIGVVPWDAVVRLGPQARQAWLDEGWAEYPRSRRYGAPYICTPMNSCRGSPARTEDLPFPYPHNWRGCLDEQRVSVGGHAARPPDEDLLDHPSTMPFAESVFLSTFGHAYQCQQWPAPHDFATQTCYGPLGWPANSQVYDRSDQYYCELTSMRPLSANASAIKDHIDRLSFKGIRTYSALGILWAQRMLMHQWADVWNGDVDPVDSSVEGHVRRVIVLFTDGWDTHCGHAFNNRNCDVWDVGLARSVACEVAKSEGVEIFVIAAMSSNNRTVNRELTACSSHDDDSALQYTFLHIESNEDIAEAFATIGLQLKTLRRTL